MLLFCVFLQNPQAVPTERCIFPVCLCRMVSPIFGLRQNMVKKENQ